MKDAKWSDGVEQIGPRQMQQLHFVRAHGVYSTRANGSESRLAQSYECRTYLTDGIPKEVTVGWKLLADQIQQVPAIATDPAGPLRTFLTPDDNVHTWTNSLKNYELPTVQVVAIAGSLGVLSVPLASLFCLALLVPAGWQVSKRARNGGASSVPEISRLVVPILPDVTWQSATEFERHLLAIGGPVPNRVLRRLRRQEVGRTPFA